MQARENGMLTDRAAPALRLRDYLSIPYLISARTFEASPGSWRREASYPELPGCLGEAATIEEALAALERRRIEIVLALLRAGTPPPVPRPPLPDADPAGVAERLGLAPLVDGLLDRTAAELHPAN